jgi:hypothetical protein
MCGKPQSTWLPACRSCGTRFADSCPICRRAIPAGRGTCDDHVGAPLLAPDPAGAGPQPAFAPQPGFRPQPGFAGPPPPPPPPVIGRSGSGRRALPLILGVVAALVGFAGVGTVLSGTSSAEARLQKYVSGSGDKEFFASDLQFRANFPTLPARTTQAIKSLDGVSMVLYTSEVGDGGFSAGAIDRPPGHFDLNMAVNGAAAGTGGHILNSSLTTFQGFPAAEFVIAVEGGRYDKGLLVLAADRIYELQSLDSANPPRGYDHFKASFHIAAPS